MIRIIKSFLKLISDIFIEFKSAKWKYFRKKIYSIEAYNGIKLKLQGEGDITRWLYETSHLLKYRKSFEFDVIELFVNNLNKDSIVFDIGANVGLFSLLASEKLKDNGRIYSFEPNATIYNIFLKNIELNAFKNIYPQELALSDQNGSLVLHTPKSEYGSDAFSFLLNNKQKTSNFDDNSCQYVKVITLDHFIEINKISKVDLIKIDIEGAELFCLKGAINLLSSANKPILIFECNDENLKEKFGYTAIDLLKFVSNLGYTLKQFHSWQWIAYPFSNSQNFTL